MFMNTDILGIITVADSSHVQTLNPNLDSRVFKVFQVAFGFKKIEVDMDLNQDLSSKGLDSHITG